MIRLRRPVLVLLRVLLFLVGCILTYVAAFTMIGLAGMLMAVLALVGWSRLMRGWRLP